MRSAKEIKKQFKRPKWRIPILSDIIENQRLILEVSLNIRENIICKQTQNHDNQTDQN
jgi:hypothetical protein